MIIFFGIAKFKDLMIISRTPFRISFVGGGTDLRSFYSEEPGQVVDNFPDTFKSEISNDQCTNEGDH